MKRISTQNIDRSLMEQAVRELRAARTELEESDRLRREPIAIVGMGCRFPGGVTTPEEYWSLLRDGVDAVTEVPKDRWDLSDYYAPFPQSPGKMYSRHGGFIENVRQFDPTFFGIAPIEAEDLDPQQLITLEVARDALEDAGIPPCTLAGSETGVFIGTGSDDFAVSKAAAGDLANNVTTYTSIGIARSIVAGRIAFTLGLHGPAIQLDTACSSALVAIHQACESLRHGECNLALAGAVNLMLSPATSVAFCQLTALAPDGHCKTFDAAANGYVRGEGCGIVVLKRLSDALNDNDTILAQINAHGINHDGHSNGLTAPNGLAQERLIRQTLEKAGIEADQVSYVEAHGTGTPLGDPIELRALNAVYGASRPATDPLFVGSVKTNFGHLEAAAGIAGLIKVVLMLQHEKIVPHLHFRNPNPHLPWNEMPIRVPTKLSDWPSTGQRMAGVSAFGFSGTNAHLVIGAAADIETQNSDAASTPATPANVTEKVAATAPAPVHLFTLSAKSNQSLRELARKYSEHIAAHPEQSLGDICFTAATGRDHFPHRLAVVATSRDALLEQLQAYVSGEETTSLLTTRGDVQAETKSGREIGFLFTGQGTQYIGMGRELYDTEPVFRTAIDRCDFILRQKCDLGLREFLYGDSVDAVGDETRLTQPALLSVQFALAALWRSWGIQPDAVMGHSLGEYTAACCAGVFDLETALELVARRGYLIDGLAEKGEMAVVMANEQSVQAALAAASGQVSIAAVNGPNSIVISGASSAVRELLATFAAAGTDTEVLNTANAGHSAMIKPMLEPYREFAESFSYASANINLISNVSGQLAGNEVAGAAYWVEHLRAPVKFSAGMQSLAELNCRTFIEIGPNPNLLAMGMGCVKKLQPRPLWLPSLATGRNACETMFYSLAEMYVHGAKIDWRGFYRPHAGSLITLPTYAYQRNFTSVLPHVQPARATVTRETATTESADHTETPSNLPSPKSIARQVDHLLTGLESESQVLTPRLNEVAIRFLIDAWQQLGFAWHLGAEVTEDEINERIPAEHRCKITRVLDRLQGDGWIERVGRTCRVSRAAPAGGAEDLLQAIQRDGPFPECDLLGRAGPCLADIWRGKAEPLSILFPAGATDEAVAFYSQAKLVVGYNQLAGECLRAAVAALPEGQTLRVLEIGAGTGGLTTHLLPHLPKGRCEYVFSDVSPLFLHAAEERFSSFPGLKTTLFDASQGPAEQGFAANRFDLVVAANVLHATPYLRETISHVRQLLKRNGWLLLLEAGNPPFWGDVIFTLIDGWWSFLDKELRPDYPLMGPDRWRRVLSEGGFEPVACLNDANLKDGSTHTLYLAQSPLATPATQRPHPPAVVDSTPRTSPAAGTAPADELIDQGDLSNLVRSQAARVMRLKPEQIDPTQPLSELGLDSLMATELRAQLGQAIEYDDLPLNTLQLRRSILEIVSYVQELSLTDREPGGMTVPEDLDVDAPRVHLVPLQSTGEKTPLYFVPAGFGDLFAFQEISHALGTNQPVYGLQPASAKQVKTIRQMSVYRLVSAYIAEIKKIQPEGPYFLSGYSAGGIIVVELARELIRQGNEVGLLVVFDPPSHVPFWLDWFYTVNYHLSKATHLLNVVRHMRWKLTRRLFHTVLDEGLRTHTSVIREHHVARYPGRITQFRARLSQSSLVSMKPVGWFWRKIAEEGVEVHWIGGTHYGMLRGSGAIIVVEELRDCLERAEASQQAKRAQKSDDRS